MAKPCGLCGRNLDAPKAALSKTALGAISGFQRSAYCRGAEYLRIKRIRQMLIVDGQIHLWQKGMPSPPHRQEPYSAVQAIAAMDEAGVDRALIHPMLWDPDSNELAVAAVRKYPDRFAIMGWFYLDDPKGRDLVANWKDQPGKERPG